MIELLLHPVCIDGKAPTCPSNIGLNFKMLRVPLARIKSPSTRAKREQYEAAMAWKDRVAWMVRAAAAARAPAGTAVFVHVAFYVRPLGKASLNPADAPQDVDNPNKPMLDALQRSGILANDKQVLRLLADKEVAADGKVRTEILSITAGHPHERSAWLALRAGFSAR